MVLPYGAFIWNDGSKGAAEHYSKSEAVRNWLVHTALAATNRPLTPALQASHTQAFKRVCECLKHGRLNLDYEPLDSELLEIPPINHPHHMQAMLYWCVRLDCTLALLSEGYARMGRGATLAQAAATLKRLADEESAATKAWVRTLGRSVSPAATRPMFRT